MARAEREQREGGTARLSERRWLLLAATAIGAFMAPFDGSVVAVALPKIGPALRLSFVGALWVQLSYLLVLTVALIPAGRLADAWGGLRLYRIGLVVFALASAAAGAATSSAWLLAARCTQGLGAALLAATATALVTEAFPGAERGKALGLNVTAVYLGLALGPALGGLLTEQLGWRSIFYVNVPVAAASLVLGWRLTSERHTEHPRAARAGLDLPGVALFVGALAAEMVGVSLAPLWGWTAVSSLALMAGGAGGVVALVAYESRRSEPFLDVGLFRRSRLFATANLAALANYMAFAAVTVLTSVFLEVVSGRSPEQAGLLLIAAPTAMVALSWLAGRASDVVGSRWLASAGMAVIGAGLFMLSQLPARPSMARLIGDLVVVGVGMAAFSSPNTSAVMGSVPRAQLGVASGILGTMRFLGQTLSIGVLGALATSRLGAGGQAVLFTGQGRGAAAASAYVAGYHLAMVAGAGIALVGAIASLTRPGHGKVLGPTSGQV
ncbi:MAG: MFS transporter [Acidimicrobiales bacterium]|jgi:EmrB/QacA subfamily drug resistance transporter